MVMNRAEFMAVRAGKARFRSVGELHFDEPFSDILNQRGDAPRIRQSQQTLIMAGDFERGLTGFFGGCIHHSA
jgi:hypothetical protein